MKIRLVSILPPRLPLTLALIERLDATLPEGYTGESQAWNKDREIDQLYIYLPKDAPSETRSTVAAITIEENTTEEQVAQWESRLAEWMADKISWCIHNRAK